MRPHAPGRPNLVAYGTAVWNLEYRRVGQQGGAWPGTLLDVAAAMDALAPAAQGRGLDLDCVVAIGHSSGGHLALWLAARPDLPPAAPGANPALAPKAVVSLAGVCDLEAAARDRLGDGAVLELLGDPQTIPSRYEMASPARRLPLRARLLLVHGTAA